MKTLKLCQNMRNQKKVVFSLKKDEFWEEVASTLKIEGFEICYWVGEGCSGGEVDGCFFHEVVDAYELKNQYRAPSIFFDVEKLSLSEYYNYLKILDRADDLGGYSFSQRDRILKDQLNYWLSVFVDMKPDLILFSNVPHLVHDYPLYLVAKCLGVRTLIFNVTPFSGWHYITDSIFSGQESNLVQVSEKNDMVKSKFYQEAVLPYAEKRYSPPYYMTKQFEHDRKSKLLRVLKNILKDVVVGLKWIPRKERMRNTWRHDFFDFIGGSTDSLGTRLVRRKLIYNFKSKLWREYNSSTVPLKQLKKIDNYIYVPLHYQPEATTAPLGNYYSDQIYMIEKLREALPYNVSILVKEHYSQFSDALSGFRGRYLGYWDKITRLENTFLVPLDVDPKDLIVNSLAVATVTGTAGWEAIQYGRRSIVFGEPWYSSYPGLIKYGERFLDDIKEVVGGQEPMDVTEKFLDDFSHSLVNVDIHGVSDGKAPRDPNEVVTIISKYLN